MLNFAHAYGTTIPQTWADIQHHSFTVRMFSPLCCLVDLPAQCVYSGKSGLVAQGPRDIRKAPQTAFIGPLEAIFGWRAGLFSTRNISSTTESESLFRSSVLLRFPPAGGIWGQGFTPASAQMYICAMLAIIRSRQVYGLKPTDTWPERSCGPAGPHPNGSLVGFGRAAL